MAGLWRIGAVGETEMERAIHYASRMNDVSSIVEVLRSDIPLDGVDRLFLAQYLQGDYRNPQGRRRKSERVGIHSLPHVANTPVQEAARLAREDMRELRVTGERIRGAKEGVIQRRAKELGVDPEKVWSAYRRGNAREMI